jgi:hypothetical protein
MFDILISGELFDLYMSLRIVKSSADTKYACRIFRKIIPLEFFLLFNIIYLKMSVLDIRTFDSGIIVMTFNVGPRY